MGEFEAIKNQVTGRPIPYEGNSQQCSFCLKVNEVLKWNGADPMWDGEFNDGDEVLLRVSKRTEDHEHGPDEEYHFQKVYHARHHGEFGQEFECSETLYEHNALITAVAEETGYDFGEDRAELPGQEYEPDIEDDALTLAQIDVLEYNSPRTGEPEEPITNPEEHQPPEPKYDIDRLPGFWPEELQDEVARRIRQSK